MLELYHSWRGAPLVVPISMGTGAIVPTPAGRIPGPLPFAGGIMDQPCCVMASLAVMRRAEAALEGEGDEEEE